MIMRKVLGVGSITDGPLGSLLNGEEAKRTVALAGRRLAFAEFWADTAGWLSSSVTHEEDLFQTWNSLLGAANHNSITNRGAVPQDSLLHSFESRVAAALGRRRHHLTHRLGRDEGRIVSELGLEG